MVHPTGKKFLRHCGYCERETLHKQCDGCGICRICRHCTDPGPTVGCLMLFALVAALGLALVFGPRLWP